MRNPTHFPFFGAQFPLRPMPHLKTLASSILVLLVVGLVAGAAIWPSTPPDLSTADQKDVARFHAQWASGNIVMLIRHAERCDRSSNACMGPDDGITQAGHDQATQIGSALLAMGISNTDVFASPKTRTVQTAQAIFNVTGREQPWLSDCENDMRKDIKAHKVSQRNLVLVTQSSCISQFDAVMGFPHAKAAEYASAVVTVLTASGKLRMLGVVNPQDWKTVAARPVAK